jgi:hypothetical protein
MNTIREGDLVMVIKPSPCCGMGKLGNVFIAGPIRPSSKGGILCYYCRKIMPPEIVVVCPTYGGKVAALTRLKKINPPAEPSHTERREEIESHA